MYVPDSLGKKKVLDTKVKVMFFGVKNYPSNSIQRKSDLAHVAGRGYLLFFYLLYSSQSSRAKN